MDRSGERRAAIKTAALREFNLHGLERTKIADICSAAEVSVGSVYHWFGSKEGIASALVLEGLQGNNAYLRKRLQGATTAEEGAHAVVDGLISWITRNNDLARFMYFATVGPAGQTHNDELEVVGREHAEMLRAFFAPHLSVSGLPGVPIDCLPSILLGPVHDYARRWLNGQVTTSLSGHRKQFRESAWRAVSGHL